MKSGSVAKKAAPPSLAAMHGLKIIANPGAGDCGAYALQHFLDKMPEYKGISTEQIRLAVAKELSASPDKYSCFIPGTQIECEQQGVPDMPKFDQYVEV